MSEDSKNNAQSPKEGEVVGGKKSAKKLYRSEKDKMIGGVCGGLAEYFEVDATLVRLLFVVATIFGGVGLLPYVILWVVIPTESSVRPISEETIKANAEEIKEKAEKFASQVQKKGDLQIWIGVFIILVGVAFLLDNFGLFRFLNINVWGLLWPLIIIYIGYKFLEKK